MWKLFHNLILMLSLVSVQYVGLSKAGLTCSTFFAGSSKSSYDKINRYLVENAKSDDNSESNMLKLINWLKSDNHRMKKSLKNTLEQFTSLTEVEGFCDLESYKILLKNDKAIKEDRAKKGDVDSENDTNLVETIFRDYFHKHAIDCMQNVYPVKYRSNLRGGVDQIRLDFVKTFSNSITDLLLTGKGIQDPSGMGHLTHYLGENPVQAIDFISKIKTIEQINNVTALHWAVQQSIKWDPFKEYGVGRQFYRYLLEPCEYYIKALGYVFVPADYDTEALSEQDKVHMNTEYYTDFLLGLSHFRVCSVLVNNDYSSLKQELEAWL